MEPNKSLDDSMTVIAALLSDIQTSHSEVFTPRACRLTIQKIAKRCAREGQSFLTKTLPRLGKAFDRALQGDVKLNSRSIGFKTYANSELPMLMGEFFSRIFDQTGMVLPVPCVISIKVIRNLLYLYYKYKVPYRPDEEQTVLDQFVRTESDIAHFNDLFSNIADRVDCQPYAWRDLSPPQTVRLIRRARVLLQRVFRSFNPYDIHPRHGPGAVATRERLWSKYRWTSVSPRLVAQYPLDAYFYASLGHVCDKKEELITLPFEESPARVLLVPKDSRGPRLISCEPLTFQWIQQGLGSAIVKWVERCPLTRYNVHFTDQTVNQRGALLGSSTGRYVTLDLKDASDRITVGLVRLLFPEPLLKCLLASRSQSTIMPDGREIKLNKYAPMGSALCFPVLALTCWALLTAGMPDTDSREGVLVYGDDIIVPTEQSANAISILESFGLAINRDKSCLHGFFRESCGVDAYNGVDVTPVRLRTRWVSHHCPDAYVAWIAYANSFYERGYFKTYELIVTALFRLYGVVPTKDLWGRKYPPVPSLYEVPEHCKQPRRRINKALQRVEFRVLSVTSRPIRRTIDGWSMLLRFFAESTTDTPYPGRDIAADAAQIKGLCNETPLSVSQYTKRHSSILEWCWR
jgi:hypothetical protein